MNELEKIDVSETWLWEKYPVAFEKLLKDHTTGKNIIWATDSYADLGDGYQFDDEILPERIINEHGQLIQPRALKSREEQIRRVKDKAEVFTPSWICNAQNNLIDEAWFGRPDVFNKEITLEDGTHTWIPTEGKIEFPEGKTWEDYIRDMRLEITCGEAPYLVSRYDAVSGEPITDLNMRIGLFDRKLRVISENVDDPGVWIKKAKIALECTYGYEWQGDNLLLAREAIFLTVFDYYRAKFGKEIRWNSVEGLAYRISWNLWQMDGLKYVIPGSCDWVSSRSVRQDGQYGEMFSEQEAEELRECEACKTGKGKHIGKYALIRDWKASKNYKNKNDDSKTKIPFYRLVLKS